MNTVFNPHLNIRWVKPYHFRMV